MANSGGLPIRNQRSSLAVAFGAVALLVAASSGPAVAFEQKPNVSTGVCELRVNNNEPTYSSCAVLAHSEGAAAGVGFMFTDSGHTLTFIGVPLSPTKLSVSKLAVDGGDLMDVTVGGCQIQRNGVVCAAQLDGTDNVVVVTMLLDT